MIDDSGSNSGASARIGPAEPNAVPSARSSRFASDRMRFVALVLFLIVVFLMGGGSRSDIGSLPFLIPLNILFVAYALSVARPGQIATIRIPLFLLSALAVLIGLQLVPLPPALWESLPGRDLYAQADAAAQLGGLWRPISLSPTATFSSLTGLSVPFAAMLLVAVQEERSPRRVIKALVAVALLSALWGLLQLAGSVTGPLYLYRVTNAGLPVGLFANRNHQAVLLAALIPAIAYLGTGAPVVRSRGSRRTGSSAIVAMALVLLFIAAILMTGSRAGTIVLAIGLAAAALVVHTARAESGAATRTGRNWTWLLIGAALAAIGLVIAVVAWFGHALALERLTETDGVEEIRGQLVPILVHMISTFFPVGAGFGAFDGVYDRFEPVVLLSNRYLNQAHNDALQLVIEGGIAAALLLVALFGWMIARTIWVVRNVSSSNGGDVRRTIAGLAYLVGVAVASLFDYPLRVPSMMAAFAIMCAIVEMAKANRIQTRLEQGADPRMRMHQ